MYHGRGDISKVPLCHRIWGLENKDTHTHMEREGRREERREGETERERIGFRDR